MPKSIRAFTRNICMAVKKGAHLHSYLNGWWKHIATFINRNISKTNYRSDQIIIDIHHANGIYVNYFQWSISPHLYWIFIAYAITHADFLRLPLALNGVLVKITCTLLSAQTFAYKSFAWRNACMHMKLSLSLETHWNFTRWLQSIYNMP